MTARDTAPLAPADFDALFDRFTTTVARLEALPAYAVGGAEGERLQAWRDGRPRPERSVRTDPWLARIATSTVAGKSWLRVRIVDEPLTSYQRYQLESFRESAAVGEQVRLIQRPAEGIVGPDFWLFDAHKPGAHAVLMHYRPDGRVDRREPVTDPEVVSLLAGKLDLLADRARPLNEVLVSDVVRGG